MKVRGSVQVKEGEKAKGEGKGNGWRFKWEEGGKVEGRGQKVNGREKK